MQDYRSSLKQVLTSHKAERWPGQRGEITALTMAAGCDIAEHIPTLIRYGRMVDRITEMGVRFGWSTRAFLFAEPKSLLSIDKFEWGSIHQSGAVREVGLYERYRDRYAGIVDFQMRQDDTTEIQSIPETDLLFIDTFHHRDCLQIELDLHGMAAKKLILLHDTETFGERGQADTSCLFFHSPTTDEPGTGLWHAIRPWLAKHPEWSVKEHYNNNNGLTVLHRT